MSGNLKAMKKMVVTPPTATTGLKWSVPQKRLGTTAGKLYRPPKFNREIGTY